MTSEDGPAGTDPVAADLRAAGARVRGGTPGDAIAGRVPRYVAAPADGAAAGALLAAAARHGLASVPRGNGTKADWGAPPLRCDLVVDTTDLTGIDHAAGDLVAAVGAGTPVADLAAVLAAAGQRLSADPVVAGSTVGGLVATGLSGPRRTLHGPLRDLTIGMTTVRADGTPASSGGRVVKNVAGYDLAKLHTGALGTLGLITSVTFRLHPLPAAVRAVSATAAAPATARAWRHAVAASTTAPTGVELDWPADGPLTLRVLLEGAEDGIEARAAEVAALLPGAATTAAPPPGWAALPGAPGATLLKAAVPPDAAADAAAGVRAAAAAAGTAADVRGSAAAGVLFAALPAGADGAAAAGAVDGARTAVAALGGSLTVPHAAPPLREHGVDLWGEVPGLALMRAIKDRFDPGRLLAPGRFAGGI
ncbi:FAD-binding oxidoreductase [Nocardiopsis trehalosi]|uniref:FAD-binding oxidoreductase n=1 Tax=Nocardiopsis trehalosi TaxID=109329 RepID=UPI000836AC56|nr:FAD-binding oxidoreductase [Nocardiopsis trehalosi]